MRIELDNEFFYRINQEKPSNLYSKFNTQKEGVLRNNENLNFYDGEWIKIKQNDYVMHIVKPAETLNKICEIHCIDKQKLMLDNELKDEHLFIGQILKIKK